MAVPVLPDWVLCCINQSSFHNATILSVVVVDAMLPQGHEPERTCYRAYCDTVPSGRPFSIQQKKKYARLFSCQGCHNTW
jgi:hypothetical protein